MMVSHPTTLITGAGKRIGSALAHHLAARGHALVLHYHRSQTEAEALAATLRAGGTKVALVQADLADTASLTTFWQNLPPCTNIIHNASRYTRDRVDSFTVADLRAHMAVNFEAPLVLTQGFLAQLPPSAQGNVLVLGDQALGWSLSPEFFTYSASKHAWMGVMDLLAAACAPRVRANMVALAPTLPGVEDTPEMFARLAARSPLARTGTVEEVLAAVDYLLASPGVTGQILGLGNGLGLTTRRV